MKDFFNLVNKKREEKAGLGQAPNTPPPAAPVEGTQPTQADFFYGSTSDLRKKRPTK